MLLSVIVIVISQIIIIIIIIHCLQVEIVYIIEGWHMAMAHLFNNMKEKTIGRCDITIRHL